MRIINKICFIITICLVYMSPKVYCQEQNKINKDFLNINTYEDSSTSNEREIQKNKIDYKQNSIIKINIPSLIFKSLLFEFEVKNKVNHSWNIGIGIAPSRTTPFGIVTSNFSNNTPNAYFFPGQALDVKMNYFTIAPSFRYYYKSKYYINPNLKYEKFGIDYNMVLFNSFKNYAQMKGGIYITSLGVNWGLQKPLKNKFYLDIYLGASCNFGNIKLIAESSNFGMSSSQIQNFKSDYSVKPNKILTHYSFGVTNQKIYRQADFILPQIRIGFLIGKGF